MCGRGWCEIMDSSPSVAVVFALLRVITSLFLFLVSSTFADNTPALRSPAFCFGLDTTSICLMPVKYPLESADFSSYDSCGYPGFQVDCDEHERRPFMNISNHIYHVLKVNYEDKYIRLVDIDVEGSSASCPQPPKRNFSFPSSPSWVNYHLSRNYSITIFYNCSSVPVDAEQHLLCSQDDTNTPPSYAFHNDEVQAGFDWYGNCAENVVVPVRFTSREMNYSSAIQYGFFMIWSATDWCKDCERSGGQCWSNSTATGCACKSGNSYNKTCPPRTPPPHQDNATLVLLY